MEISLQSEGGKEERKGRKGIKSSKQKLVEKKGGNESGSRII